MRAYDLRQETVQVMEARVNGTAREYRDQLNNLAQVLTAPEAAHYFLSFGKAAFSAANVSRKQGRTVFEPATMGSVVLMGDDVRREFFKDYLLSLLGHGDCYHAVLTLDGVLGIMEDLEDPIDAIHTGEL